jgi:hypothetical protein
MTNDAPSDWNPEENAEAAGGLELELQASAMIAAWSGSLPWHLFPSAVLQRMFEHVGMGPQQAQTQACRATGYAPGKSDGMVRIRRQDLIERQAVKELASAGIIHTRLWRFRVTANEAGAAMSRLVEMLERDDHYEVAVAAQALPFGFTVRGRACIVAERIDSTSAPADAGFVSHSPEMSLGLRVGFEGLWNAEDTLRERDAVLQFLRGQVEMMRNRVIL